MSRHAGSQTRPAPAKRRIIERPRLTRLLDQADARVITLVAPAGYGKTTLASQWLAPQPHVWFRANSGSADVAALAAGIADAAAAVTGASTDGVTHYLTTTPDPESELDVLARLAADGFDGISANAWLAIDDYHHLRRAAAAEAFVEAVRAAAGTNLMVISRDRPSWATARRLLYGEILEVPRHTLAMDRDEANAVLGAKQAATASGLIALAEGWPAVIGLAALTTTADAPDDAVAGALYEFFAEELLRNLDDEDGARLVELAVAPAVTTELARTLFGEPGVTLLERAERVGFVTPSDPEWSIHPLLRNFLLVKFRELPDRRRKQTVRKIFDLLVRERDWDHAFAVAEAFDRGDLTERLVSTGLGQILSAGRFTTARRWLDHAQHSSFLVAATTALEAEVAFRQGAHAAAETLAAQAAAQLPRTDVLRQRALLRAGQAAYFQERYEQALAHLDAAIAVGRESSLQRDAAWTAFIASLDLETPEASGALERFERLRKDNIDDTVRMSNARLLIATRRGGVSEAVAQESRTTHLLRAVRDPMIRTAFLNIYGCALALNARYDEARLVAQQEAQEAERSELRFVVPHAHLLEALSAVGLKELDEADALLMNVSAIARDQHDVFLGVSAAAIRCRLLIAAGDTADAVRATAVDRSLLQNPIRGGYGELLGLRAVALAATGAIEEARSIVDRLFASTSHAEPVAFATLAAAISAYATEGGPESAVAEAISAVAALGHLDSLVTAYRAFPELVEVAARTPHAQLLRDVLRRARDEVIEERIRAGAVGAVPTTGRLSRREAEVLELVAAGRTNDEVARALFISSVTVKAHLRHIYEKLGVRNRVEAAARIRERQLT